MTDNRIVVIGGGLAGLVAAATAARAGANVTLFEARAHEGGRARTNRAADGGFLFNQGPHALCAGSCGIGVLRELGIEPAGKRPSLRGYGSLRRRIALLPGTPIDALRSSLVGTRAKWQLARAVGNPGRMLRTDTAGLTMREWIDRQASEPDARAIIAMAARVATYCGDLDGIAAENAVAQTVASLVDGVLYLDGGWQQLVDGLRVAAERAGAKLVTGAKATAVEPLDGGQVRIVVDDATVDADAAVIASGGPVHADALVRHASATLRGWAERERPVLAATLDLGLESLPVPQRRVVFGVDEPYYLSVHTPSAALAPDGGEVMHVMKYGVDGTEDARALRDELEDFLDRAQPGWRAVTVAEHFNRSLVVAHGRPEAGAARPTPTVDDLRNVFVAGDWVGPDGLLADASFASGRAAGRLAAAAPQARPS